MIVRTTLLCGIASFAALAQPAQAALIHDFQLNDSYASSVGPDIIGNAGGALGATGYSFGVNQGLSIALTGPLSTYTIKTAFRLDTVTGYRKIVDFKNLGSDYGFYAFDGKFSFFPVRDSAVLFAAGEDIVATISRDAAGIVSASLNGVEIWAFNDSDGQAIFDSGFIHLFRDDYARPGEASSGFVDYVQVYDTATIPAPVPEPASWAMLIAGFALAGGTMRRRQRATSIAYA